MARKAVVEVQCSRCARKEFVEEAKLPQAGTGSPAILIRMEDGASVQFDDLCGPCLSAVNTHVAAIAKKIEGVSPERKKGRVVSTEEVMGVTSVDVIEPKKDGAKKKDPPPEGVPSR